MGRVSRKGNWSSHRWLSGRSFAWAGRYSKVLRPQKARTRSVFHKAQRRRRCWNTLRGFWRIYYRHSNCTDDQKYGSAVRRLQQNRRLLSSRTRGLYIWRKIRFPRLQRGWPLFRKRNCRACRGRCHSIQTTKRTGGHTDYLCPLNWTCQHWDISSGRNQQKFTEYARCGRSRTCIRISGRLSQETGFLRGMYRMYRTRSSLWCRRSRVWKTGRQPCKSTDVHRCCKGHRNWRWKRSFRHHRKS